jgi:hypothetical protein
MTSSDENDSSSQEEGFGAPLHKGEGMTIEQLDSLLREYLIDYKKFDIQFITSENQKITPA